MQVHLSGESVETLAWCEELGLIFGVGTRNQLVVHTTEGVRVRNWSQPFKWNPNAVAVVSVPQQRERFRVVVVDSTGFLHIFDTHARRLARWHVPGASPLHATVAVWNSAQVFVVDGSGLVTVMDVISGQRLCQWSVDTRIKIAFVMECSLIKLAVSITGYVVVSTENVFFRHGQTQLYTRTGQHLLTMQPWVAPSFVTVRDATVLVCTTCNTVPRVQVWRSDGRLLRQFESPIHPEIVQDSAVLKSGHLVFLDKGNMLSVFE